MVRIFTSAAFIRRSRVIVAATIVAVIISLGVIASLMHPAYASLLLFKFGTAGSGNGQFVGPVGIVVDSTERIIVSDTFNGRVQVFDSSGNFLFKFGTPGSGNGQLSIPAGVAVDSSDNIVVTDRGNHRVQVFDPAGNFLFKFGSFGSGDGQFQFSAGVEVDNSGSIIVVDADNDRLQKFTSSGTFLGWSGKCTSGPNCDIPNQRSIGYSCTASTCAGLGPGSGDGQFNTPERLEIDSSGRIIVSDSHNHRIQVFDPAGNFLFKFGGPGSGDGQLSFPHDLGVDSCENFVVADNNHRVQVFDPAGNFLFKFGSFGSGDEQFSFPEGMEVDSSDRIIVADTFNHRVQVFQSPTTISPPTISSITAPVDPVRVGTVVSVGGSFTDPDTCDTHTAQWNWGDGTISPGIVTESGGSGSVTGSHVYSSAGVYIILLTVTDDDGNSATLAYEFVVVYDPEGGFVTGGGWIDSPAGAYGPDASLTGKAIFGFTSKYEKGATTPTGKTSFKFHVASLDFNSDIYEWLVVAGTKAQFKGTGTINGDGEYGFMLTAIDGQINGGGGVDKFRIKIWDKATDALVYDNQQGAGEGADPTTVIGGGGITIHK